METKKKIATELFSSGFNCSQSVIAAYSEYYGVSKELALKISSGFGGGVRSGDVCGAVTGAVMVIGLKDGHCVLGDTETKSNCYNKTIEFLESFKSENKSTVCRELLAFNGGNKDVCPKLIESAVEILEDMGY